MTTDGIISLDAGDIITIQMGCTNITGEVYSATYLGPYDGWCIEMYHTDDGMGYICWVQKRDGGRITEINGYTVDNLGILNNGSIKYVVRLMQAGGAYRVFDNFSDAMNFMKINYMYNPILNKMRTFKYMDNIYYELYNEKDIKHIIVDNNFSYVLSFNWRAIDAERALSDYIRYYYNRV